MLLLFCVQFFMTPNDVQSRLTLLKQDRWSFDQIKEWFEIDLLQEPKSILAQYRIWAERDRNSSAIMRDLERNLISRNGFEIFLQHRELVGIRSAAVQWGMTTDSFLRVLQAAKGQYVSEGEANGEFPGVYRASLVSDIHKRFPKLERMIFSTYSGFVRRLHEQIREVLNISVEPLHCLTSKAIRDTTPDFAHDFDSITSEPMGLGFQLWLNTDKSVQLRPDSCSWATYFRFEDLLKNEILGRRDEQLEKYRNVIREYFHL